MKMAMAKGNSRTLIIEKESGSYGFTLQSYGIKHHGEKDIEYLTYVDFVLENGPAGKAGMRPGDVILSINGVDMEHEDHQLVVNYLQQCPDRIRMAVRFEDCVRKVNLHVRYVKLQAALYERVKVYNQLCEHEKRIVSHICQRKRMTELRESKSVQKQQDSTSQAQAKMCRCKCMKKSKNLSARSETHLTDNEQSSSIKATEINEKLKRFSLHYPCTNGSSQIERSNYAKIISTKSKKQSEWRSQPDIQEAEQFNAMAYGGYGFVYGYAMPKSPKHKPQTLPRGTKKDEDILEGGIQRTASAGTELASDQEHLATRRHLKSAEDLLLKQQVSDKSSCFKNVYSDYRNSNKCWWK
ncbi:hypothetical protein QYM36_001930 [Artemia franciscana]|uniref:PDZ domain-containing protein n=1 Tax=Artemia franciscana TaxID=6661 RepID=A0AA88IFN4_ARTSF|nr:hypothetical protein QYM36_001930 [Artemia franciscana]